MQTSAAPREELLMYNNDSVFHRYGTQGWSKTLSRRRFRCRWSNLQFHPSGRLKSNASLSMWLLNSCVHTKRRLLQHIQCYKGHRINTQLWPNRERESVRLQLRVRQVTSLMAVVWNWNASKPRRLFGGLTLGTDSRKTDWLNSIWKSQGKTISPLTLLPIHYFFFFATKNTQTVQSCV